MLALVIGGAGCVWDDLLALGPVDAVVFGVNDGGAQYTGQLDHFCTLHPEKLGGWRKHREQNGLNVDFSAHTHKRKQGCGEVTIHDDWGGSSGLLAVKVALSLGFNRIVLCGVPMDAQPHFNRPIEWPDCHHYRKHWKRVLDQYAPFTRSMSGWTRELLGSPDQWLGQAQGVEDGSIRFRSA